jgi:tetratricopeptide (TPR) repeat protein
MPGRRSSSSYVLEGRARLDEGEYAAAVEAFSKALRLGLGDMAGIYVQRGEAYAYLEQWHDALADFQQALQEDPYHGDAYCERGSLRRFLGDLEGALEDYNVTLRIDHEHLAALYNRAQVHEALGDMPAAEADLSHSIMLDPGMAPAYEARARVRAALGEDDGAIDDYRRYLRMGGGRDYDNQGEIRAQLLLLVLRRGWRRVVRRVRPRAEAV